MSGHDDWSAGDADDGSDAEEDVDRIRGWIDPDDRLWRHPSEIGSRATSDRRPGTAGPRSTSGAEAALLTSGHLGRRGVAPWLICGSLAIAIAVTAVAVAVADTGEGSIVATTTAWPTDSAPTTDPGTALGTRTEELDAALATVRSSTVALHVVRGSGASTVMGVVAEAGGMVATSARGIAGATRITAVEPDGTREAAVVVGVDRTSDLAVVRVPDDLPAANLDDAALGTGAATAAVMLRPRRHAAPTSLVYAGTVVAAGTTVPGDSVTATFASTAVRAPLSGSDLGCPLVDRSGHVVGMLEATTGSGAARDAVFLPATLVAGVARQLVASGTVDRGWFGAEGSAATEASATATVASLPSASTGGALLTSVTSDSPAAEAGLAAGDAVRAVDGAPVHSMAELMTRLYPDPPGTSVAVTFVRAATAQTVEVQLADGDADPGVSPSP
ncbi:MAG: PDZ domain-containing protein [Acidimicrobiales bacterium]|nr:PDZ domain-containing protein [Acidimicrobiales bacterium]